MGHIASILMVAAAVPCVIGAINSRSRMAITASSVMFLAMVDLAFVNALPPVLWSGLLLLVGLCIAMRLGSRLKEKPTARAMTTLPEKVLISATTAHAPAHNSMDSTAESSSLERPTEWHKARPFPHLGRSSAILSAAAYPIMAWQVLNHGAHHASAGADAHAVHQHHGQAFDGSLASGVITLSVIVVSLLLALCAVQALTRKRPALMFESLGMATMLLIMQFMN
ncbi:hypothetical protein PGC08_01650 [Brevibacterium sp. BDJS002]|uniref:hypothetical protein n=1 Tax=Brevibacterium sp. BDJS002 TaxID=3020906 RepID=UPI002307D13E|nr:hypothetical protein [Brevibacterium sp. BDJS002]WCE40430.1 hypothetical protein PGC08_01650 [Brevibacterium sp. BDJS002]